MNKETFMAEAKKKRKKNIEELTLKVLAKMLNDDVRYFDAHYIQDRTMEILNKTMGRLNFKSEEIRKARRAFLDVLLDGAKKRLFGYDYTYEEAKKGLKVKSEKNDAIKTLKRIDRIRNGHPQGLTEKRDMECEPVCQMIAEELLSREVVLKDEEFVDGCIEWDNEMLISTLSMVSFKELFDQLITSLDQSYITANEKNWGCSRDEIRLKQIDNRIKE